MKTILTSLVLATAAAVAQEQPVVTLKPGAAVNLEAVAAAKWIQGEAPKAFEPGKVYMFECWATWCGPCIAAIPHVNELHKKYYEKGLRVFGMNVWEDGEDKVAKFVKDKGDGMSYPVAYTGRGSAFETEWLKAAGVRGIPHAFIVMDGKLALTSHPSQLTDAVIEALLSGEDGAKKAAAELNAAREAQEKTSGIMMAFRQAAAKGDTEAMAAKLAEMEQAGPQSPYLPALRLEVQVAKKDWPAATKALEELPAGPARQMAVMMTARKVGMEENFECPAEFTKATVKAYESLVGENKGRANPLDQVTLCYLHHKAGDKAAALASAQAAVEVAKGMPQGTLPAAPFERFAKAVEEGKLPTMQELSGWMREAAPQRRAVTPAVPVKPAPKAEE